MAVILYDSILLIAVMFFASYILIASIGGEAIESNNIPYKIFLLSIAWLYFCFHWTRGGQTLGMRSWHVYLVNNSELNPDWKQASLRYLAALLSLSLAGLGFIWALFDKRKFALHDHLSKTHLITKRD